MRVFDRTIPDYIVPWPWSDRGRGRLVETPDQILALHVEAYRASELYSAAMRVSPADFVQTLQSKANP